MRVSQFKGALENLAAAVQAGERIDTDALSSTTQTILLECKTSSDFSGVREGRAPAGSKASKTALQRARRELANPEGRRAAEVIELRLRLPAMGIWFDHDQFSNPQKLAEFAEKAQVMTDRVERFVERAVFPDAVHEGNQAEKDDSAEHRELRQDVEFGVLALEVDGRQAAPLNLQTGVLWEAIDTAADKLVEEKKRQALIQRTEIDPETGRVPRRSFSEVRQIAQRTGRPEQAGHRELSRLVGEARDARMLKNVMGYARGPEFLRQCEQLMGRDIPEREKALVASRWVGESIAQRRSAMPKPPPGIQAHLVRDTEHFELALQSLADHGEYGERELRSLGHVFGAELLEAHVRTEYHQAIESNRGSTQRSLKQGFPLFVPDADFAAQIGEQETRQLRESGLRALNRWQAGEDDGGGLTQHRLDEMSRALDGKGLTREEVRRAYEVRLSTLRFDPKQKLTARELQEELRLAREAFPDLELPKQRTLLAHAYSSETRADSEVDGAIRDCASYKTKAFTQVKKALISVMPTRFPISDLKPEQVAPKVRAALEAAGARMPEEELQMYLEALWAAGREAVNSKENP